MFAVDVLVLVLGLLMIYIGMMGLRVRRNARRLPDPYQPGYEGVFVSHGMAVDSDTGELVDVRYVNDYYYECLFKK